MENAENDHYNVLAAYVNLADDLLASQDIEGLKTLYQLIDLSFPREQLDDVLLNAQSYIYNCIYELKTGKKQDSKKWLEYYLGDEVDNYNFACSEVLTENQKIDIGIPASFTEGEIVKQLKKIVALDDETPIDRLASIIVGLLLCTEDGINEVLEHNSTISEISDYASDVSITGDRYFWQEIKDLVESL